MPYRTTKERDVMWDDVKRIVNGAKHLIPEAKRQGNDSSDEVKVEKVHFDEVSYWTSLSLKTQEVMDRLLKSALNNSIDV